MCGGRCVPGTGEAQTGGREAMTLCLVGLAFLGGGG